MAESAHSLGGTPRPSVRAFTAAILTRRGIADLGRHLEMAHGIRATLVTELDVGVFRVDQTGGPSLVARVFPSLRPVGQTRDDSEVLRRLEARGFPAERCAGPDPVSMLEGQPVLLTTFVDGGRGPRGPRTLGLLGDLLARLEAQPVQAPALTRPAGSWHHLSPEGGGRRRDLDALGAYLTERAEEAGAGEHDALAILRDAVEQIDDGQGLPTGFAHPDLTPPNVVMSATGPVVIDWTGAGLAPRIFSLGFLLWVAGAGGPDLIDAVVAGYRRHITLEAEELDRLPSAIGAMPLILAAWRVVVGRARGVDVVARLSTRHVLADRIARQARTQFAL